MNLLTLITELRKKHEFGCVMLYLDFPQINTVHKIIRPEDIYTDDEGNYGLEKEPHTTLLFGLHNDVSSEDVESVINKITFGSCKIKNPSLFQNVDSDILKYDVEGQGLHEANQEFRKFHHTNDFPNYYPHLTIAYLKPNTGQKYANALKGQSYTITPKFAIFSKIDGTKEKLNINTKK